MRKEIEKEIEKLESMRFMLAMKDKWTAKDFLLDRELEKKLEIFKNYIDKLDKM
jgi:hypothetical protein